MNKEKIQKKIKIKAVIVFAVAFILINSIAHTRMLNQKNEEKLKASYTAESTVRHIESQLSQYLVKSNILKKMIESGEEVNDENFAKWAKYLQDDQGVLKAVELAPNGVVSQIYPLKGNERAMGLNMLKHPNRKLEASLTRNSGEYTIAGPFELTPGGIGALLFEPIYTTDRNGDETFWGFAILVLDWEKFIKDVGLDELENTSYHYQIWKKDMQTGEHISIAQCKEPINKDTLEVKCDVPNDTWYVDIAPKNGWISRFQLWIDSLICMMLAILLTVVYWQMAMRRYHEVVYTDEIMRSEREARSANEAKTRFLFNMSHDIRTPMNAIIGFADLIKKNMNDPDKVRDYIEKIQSSSTLLLSIINHVLEMARIESGEVTLSEQVGNIQELVTSIETVFEPTIQKKKLICSYEANVEHEYVICDETKVREIFLNIIGNAVKYTEQGGNIRVSVTEFPDHEQKIATYRIVVKDNGSGMSEEYLPHIFETFSREHSSTEVRVEGTGLGLPIVKSFLDLMGGTIQVESRPGEGTQMTIEVSFPIADEKQIREHQGQKKHRVMKNWKNKRILLAEDNDLNAEIVTTLLQENEFIVERVADGEPCVNMVKCMPSDYYRVILMDIQMPHMDGYQATQAIRKLDGARSQIPIIALTANAFEEDRQKAFACGMNAHVVKPIDMEQLLDALDTFTV